MQKILPHLWFDKEAREAALFYTSLFAEGVGAKRSAITSLSTLKNTPAGDCDVVVFTLWGCSFMAISAGPMFKINPSISFMVNFDPAQMTDAPARIDAMWSKLIEGGKVLMPLDTYPFSKHYGWVEDKYGVSWQLMLTDPAGEERPLIIPALLFTGERCGHAEAATEHYLSVFKGAPGTQAQDVKRGTLARYPAGSEPNKEGTVMFTDFMLHGQWFAAMDSALQHEFAFNEAVSLMVGCDTQEEIDYYWEKLSAVPEAEQCGWLKDKFGVSWQIVPSKLETMLVDADEEKVARVTKAFLEMKKFDLAELDRAYQG